MTDAEWWKEQERRERTRMRFDGVIPFCVNGHDIEVVGRYPAGNCRQCAIDRGKKRYQSLKDAGLVERTPQGWKAVRIEK